MQSVLSRLNRFFELAPQVLLPFRWSILFLFIVLTGGMVYSMVTYFKMDMSLESWFQDEDPAKLSLDEFRRQFGSDDGLYIVYRAEDGDVFSETSLRVLSKIHEEIDQARLGLIKDEDKELSLLERIERVDSLINVRYQIADGDTLVSRKLIGSMDVSDEKQREAARAIAQNQEGFELAYYSKDYKYGGIRIKTDFGMVPTEQEIVDHSESLLDEDDFDLGDDYNFSDDLEVDEQIQVEDVEFQDMQMEEYLHFMVQIKQITEKEEYQHLEFYYVGNAPLMEFAMEIQATAGLLLLLMVVIVVFLLWFLFHSLSAVVWPMFVIAGSAFWAIGFGALVGVTFSSMVPLTFMLILAVGIADCVHVLSAYISFRREHLPHRQAMTKAYRKTGLPILLTTITTMMGMSALSISDIPQISVFGLFSALGVFMAFVLTIFVLPVLLDIWHPYNDKKLEKLKKTNKKHWLLPLLDSLPEFVGRFPKRIVMSYFAIFIVFVIGATQVKIDSNFAELTKEGSRVRVTYDVIDKHMMGGQNMEVYLDFGQQEALKEPEVLQAIDAFQKHAQETYPQFVVKTFSLADFVKETNRAMHEGRQEYYRIPDDARLCAQLIYLFDNANPEDRRNLVSDDYSKSHISLQLRNRGSHEYSQFFEQIQMDVDRIFAGVGREYSDMDLHATGSLALMMELIDHISRAQLQSFSLALLIITVLLMFTLGSVQAGLISMVPNLLPAFFTFGVMGLLGIPLDTDTLIIAPLIIGIAVDDTIHFIAHYRDAWFQSGDVDKALHSTIKEVGQAVTFTTLILGIGFSMLAFSDYLGLAKTGIFGSLAIFVALSSDLLLMPALIKWFKPDLGREKYLAKTQLKEVYQ